MSVDSNSERTRSAALAEGPRDGPRQLEVSLS